jgi:hypothetical protein
MLLYISSAFPSSDPLVNQISNTQTGATGPHQFSSFNTVSTLTIKNTVSSQLQNLLFKFNITFLFWL